MFCFIILKIAMNYMSFAFIIVNYILSFNCAITKYYKLHHVAINIRNLKYIFF